MSTPKLTTISFVILGLIGLRGPSTPYDLERATSRSIGYFWPFPRAQLYSEPKRLVESGLLDVSIEEGGRRRQTFSLTDLGRRFLDEWLSESESEPMQIRDVAELKLFFSELSSPENVRSLAEEQIKQHSERLEIYRKMLHRYVGTEELKNRLIPLELGIRIEEAVTKFWSELKDDPSWAGEHWTISHS